MNEYNMLLMKLEVKNWNLEDSEKMFFFEDLIGKDLIDKYLLCNEKRYCYSALFSIFSINFVEIKII